MRARATNEFVRQTEQVDATVAQDADLKALVDQKLPLFGTSQGLRLKWFSGDDLVAELNDADAGWFDTIDWCLVTTRDQQARINTSDCCRSTS